MNKLFNIKVEELKFMNLIKEAELLSDIQKDFNNNRINVARKKLVILSDHLDKKGMYKKADDIDGILKISYFGGFSQDATEQQIERKNNPYKKSRGPDTPEVDPNANSVSGRAFKAVKNRIYRNILNRLGIQDGSVAAQLIYNILATITFDEAKQIARKKDCSLLDQNIYDGIDITKNNLNIDPDTMSQVESLLRQILVIGLGLPENSVAKSRLSNMVGEKTIYKFLDNMQKDIITEEIRNVTCKELQELNLLNIIKGVF